MTPSDPDTDALIEQAQNGDQRARGELLTRHRDRLRKMVSMRIDERIACRVDPSDVVQEAMVQASGRLSDYLTQRPRPFYPWLRQITWDKLLEAHRRHIGAEKRSVLRERTGKPELSSQSFCDLASLLVTSGLNPSRRVVQAEMVARVLDALKQLPPHDRELLVLRHLEQLGVPEIADVLGVSETVVSTRHLRALQRLRRLLGDEFGNAPP